jgi:hypothetical protein
LIFTPTQKFTRALARFFCAKILASLRLGGSQKVFQKCFGHRKKEPQMPQIFSVLICEIGG